MKARAVFAVTTCLILLFLSLLQAAVSEDNLELAAEYFQKGEYKKALSYYEKATQNKRFAHDAYLGIARVRIETGDYDQALRAVDEAEKIAPSSADALSLKGEILYAGGDYSAARATFEQALQSNPEHLQARLNLGKMQWAWGEKQLARETLQYFISYYRSNAQPSAMALSMVAEACIYLEKFRDANDLFSDAIKAEPTYWQAYIPWGNLFLSKYNIADARGVFEDALKVNPNCVEALLGLAICSKRDNLERARELADRALDINANLAAAYDLKAELEIVMEDYASALEKLADPLKINPHSLSTRTLRAVCYYALNEKQKFDTEEATILAVNPSYSALYFEIAELLSRRYLFKESVDFYKKAISLDPENWSARAGLGTSLSRLGLEAQARQELEKAFARDPFNKYVGNLLTLFDEYPEYKTHQLDNFTIRLHEKDDAILYEYVKELVRKSYMGLVGKYNVKDNAPVVLEIFPEHDDFAVRCFGLPGAQAFLGICFGNVVAMDSPRAREKGDFVWGETLWHELVHVTHLRLTRNRIPRWLAEGIAVYETTLANPYWSMNLDLPLIHAFQNDRLLHLRDLDSGFNRPTGPGQVTLSYFQASLVVDFLVTTYTHQKLLETFPKFAKGLQTAEIFESVFEKDIDTMNDEFGNFLRQRYRLDKVDYAYDPRELAKNGDSESYLFEKVDENPENPFFNHYLGLYYKEKGQAEDAITYLKKSKELFPQNAGKGNPYWALAQIYLERDEKARAIAELTELTSINGKDLNSLDLLAKLALEAGDAQLATATLQKMIFISPFDPDVHRKLATLYLDKRDYDKAITEFRLQLLTEPPDLAAAHCDLANAYLKAGRIDEAKDSALTALEIAPSYGRAQEILLACIE